jgi:hypothetical protein
VRQGNGGAHPDDRPEDGMTREHEWLRYREGTLDHDGWMREALREVP